MFLASKQKAAAVAGKSKSSEKSEKSKDNEDIAAIDTGKKPEASDAESILDDPITIESEASEVEAEAGDFPPDQDEDTATQADAESADKPEDPESLDSVQEGGRTEDDQEEVLANDAYETKSIGGGASVLALVFGGIIAGAIGYFASSLAPRPEAPAFDDTELSAGIAANTAALSELESGISALQNTPAQDVDFSPLETEIGSIAETLNQLEASLSDLRGSLSDTAAAFETKANELDDRIVALETAVPEAGELATGDELSDLRARIEEMMVNAETRLAEAQAEAEQITLRAAEARAASEAEAQEIAAAAEAREAELAAMAQKQAALVDLKAAVEAGASYADVLPALGPVPEALSANADNGVPTFKSLRDSFPDAARAALSASSVVSEDASTGERLTAFLKRRTNARSLTEQEGDGPDAVLSRAEARLDEGDLSAAVTELEDMPEAGKSALADWLEQAQTRLAALAAIDELTATN